MCFGAGVYELWGRACRGTERDGVEDGFVEWDFEFVAGEGVVAELMVRYFELM